MNTELTRRQTFRKYFRFPWDVHGLKLCRLFTFTYRPQPVLTARARAIYFRDDLYLFALVFQRAATFKLISAIKAAPLPAGFAIRLIGGFYPALYP